MIESVEWTEKVAATLEQLSESEKQLIQWIFVDGLTQKECAEKLEFPKLALRREGRAYWLG